MFYELLFECTDGHFIPTNLPAYLPVPSFILFHFIKKFQFKFKEEEDDDEKEKKIAV